MFLLLVGVVCLLLLRLRGGGLLLLCILWRSGSRLLGER
jgi:hypothetical protein